jgi:membrane associated rhomboid family serine protease
MHQQTPNSTSFPPGQNPYVGEGERAQLAEREFAQRVINARPRVTILIIGACVAVYVMELLWAQGGTGRSLVDMGALVGTRVIAGEWWRLWSCTFLHAGVIHIGANMTALWSLGRQMEALLGSRRFLILYALCGLVGSLVCTVVEPRQPVVGASGAIWGLLGAMLGLALRPHGLIPPGIAMRMRRGLMQPLLINLGISLLPGISLMAHLGGGLTGLGLVFSGLVGGGLHDLSEVHGKGSWTSQWVSWVAIVLAVLMVVSMLIALYVGHPWAPNPPNI